MMFQRTILFVVGLGLASSACHLDGALFSAIDDEGHFRPPAAPSTTITGRFGTEPPFGVSGAQVEFYLADGTRAADLSASVGDDGAFSATLPGTESYTNLIIYAKVGSLTLWGLFPDIPAAEQVYDYPRTIVLGEVSPPMNPVDDVATTITLLIEGKARLSAGGLGSISAGATEAAIIELEGLLDDEPVLTFRRIVTRLLTQAVASTDSQVSVFVPPDRIAEVGSSLNPDFLRAHPVDYDGNGVDDLDTASYEDALSAAVAAFQFDVCYDPDLIKVVVQVDMREGQLDLNCQIVDTFGWITPDSGDRVFITGAVHEDMVRCVDAPDDELCATDEDITLTNDSLGNFIPNLIELYDNGNSGDATAGDGIFSRAFELPRGMRIGYKYTYGSGGEGWTGTEEWPGNSRLLELVDVTGDEVLVRRDVFGDESANKDRANSLSPARGGRGSISWDSDANSDGLIDAREIMIDTDGDCIADSFPLGGPNEPLTLACD